MTEPVDAIPIIERQLGEADRRIRALEAELLQQRQFVGLLKDILAEKQKRGEG